MVLRRYDAQMGAGFGGGLTDASEAEYNVYVRINDQLAVIALFSCKLQVLLQSEKDKK